MLLTLWKENKLAILSIVSVSLFAFAFLFWLIYIQQAPTQHIPAFEFLPTANAIFNTLSTICIIAGIYSIKRGLQTQHMAFMLSALAFSSLFLISYVVYHGFMGDTTYPGFGIMRAIYLFILITHILLTIIGLPMILASFYFGFRRELNKHKFIARFTYPIWLYISVTGVIIYLMLRVF